MLSFNPWTAAIFLSSKSALAGVPLRLHGQFVHQVLEREMIARVSVMPLMNAII